MIQKEIYKARRESFLRQLDDGITILESSQLKQRSNDTEFPFRQDSNFYYLTGFKETNSILVLTKNGKKVTSTIYVEEKNPQLELWTGIRLGEIAAANKLGVDKSFSNKLFQDHIENLIVGHSNLYINAFSSSSTNNLIMNTASKLWARRNKQGKLPESIIHVAPILEKMRLQKSEEEIKSIKQAADITKKAHLSCMAYAAPNKNERDLEACLHYFFRKNGGSGEAYGSIVASGNNANILHYIENDKKLIDGELILIDAGAEKDLYACDVTRTFPVNGKFTAPQKEIYTVVLNSQKKAIESSKPGITLNEIHEVASKELIKGLISLELLTGNVDDIYAKNEHKKFYPHGTGHWLGLDVHDQCPYVSDDEEEILLEEGMYFTVEPGIYLNSNDDSIPEKYRGIGVRIEDDVLITKSGHEVTTKDIPKEIVDIEKACSKNYQDFFNQS